MVIDAPISVVVVFAPQPRQVIEQELTLPAGTTAQQAVVISGLLQGWSPEQLQPLELGVWGKKASARHVLIDGDRLEIYRALTVDPKVARRERFARQGARTAGLFAKRRPGAKPGY
jgi:uncharacterized protein